MKLPPLTAKISEDFSVALQVGASRSTAAQYADVPMGAVREWLELGKTQPRPGQRAGPHRRLFQEFRRIVIRSRSAFEVKAMGKMVTAKDWRGAKAAIERFEKRNHPRSRKPAAPSDPERATWEAWALQEGGDARRIAKMSREMLCALYAAAHEDEEQQALPAKAP